jgi:hypothetical protein
MQQQALALRTQLKTEPFADVDEFHAAATLLDNFDNEFGVLPTATQAEISAAGQALAAAETGVATALSRMRAVRRVQDRLSAEGAAVEWIAYPGDVAPSQLGQLKYLKQEIDFQVAQQNPSEITVNYFRDILKQYSDLQEAVHLSIIQQLETRIWRLQPPAGLTQAAQAILDLARNAATALVTNQTLANQLGQANAAVQHLEELHKLALRTAEVLSQLTTIESEISGYKQEFTDNEGKKLDGLRNAILGLCGKLAPGDCARAEKSLSIMEGFAYHCIDSIKAFHTQQTGFAEKRNEITLRYKKVCSLITTDIKDLILIWGHIDEGAIMLIHAFRAEFDFPKALEILVKFQGVLTKLYAELPKKKGASDDTNELEEDVFVWDNSVCATWKNAKMNELCALIEKPGELFLLDNVLYFARHPQCHKDSAAMTKAYLDAEEMGGGTILRGYFKWKRDGNVITVTPWRVATEHGGKGAKRKLEGKDFERA